MENIKKAAAIAIILALVINLVLFAARKIHALQFWIIIVVAAILAFLVLPRFFPKKSSK